MLEIILEMQARQLESCNFSTKRYLYPSFNIESRLTGLIGPRGVGKTTLMLQYINEHLHDNDDVIYFSADFIYFRSKTLFEFVRELYINGGYKIFFIDEIHQYEGWEQELKNLYDGYPDINLVFSGSSMLDLVKGSYDLSRRSKLYRLHGLSFREYLNFTDGSELLPILLERLLNEPKKVATSIGLVDKLGKKLKDYLAGGYYPFALENRSIYPERLSRIIDKTIYEDIANFYNLKTPNLHVFKRILAYLAAIPPGEVNTHKLAQNIQMSSQSTTHYLTILNEVGLIRMIYTDEGGNATLRKPQKIFLNNTTLLHTLNQYADNTASVGTTRELFFIQSVIDSGLNVNYSRKGDYQVEKILFEIGGKNKSRKQLQGAELEAYLVKDDILIPAPGTIPLLYFGMLY